MRKQGWILFLCALLASIVFIFFYRHIRPRRQFLPRPEKTITIIPGWTLRDVAMYLENENVASSTRFFSMVGFPARWTHPMFDAIRPDVSSSSILREKPNNVSFEGYLAPETYRIFADSKLEDVILKLIDVRTAQISTLKDAIKKSGRSAHAVLTMASILEQEVKSADDRRMVADIFWRRLDRGWPLEADSTVHYAVGKKKTIFTTVVDRAMKSPWNTYQYTGLPPGPICNPSVDAIHAAVYPKKNEYWFFLTAPDGSVKYARTLDEHNRNRAVFLR